MRTERLESFSIEELYALADRMGLDLPPNLDRPFVIEELLEALAEDSEERRSPRGDAVHVDEKKFCATELDGITAETEEDGSLEERYNETMIHAIVRDPSWAFAFWDLSDAELGELRGDESSAGLFLRVAEVAAPGAPQPAGDQHREYFDIPIADDDRQWYINLPQSGIRFRIDLCARRPGMMSGKIRIMARSNEVTSPRQAPANKDVELDEGRRELLSLSGMEELHLEAPGDSEAPRSEEPRLSGFPAKAASEDAALG